jgi:hypothetical protein
MGLFTNVEIAEKWLPDEYGGLTDWQTKDVINDPFMETLIITNSGQLIYVWFEREWETGGESFFGGHFRTTVEHRDILDFHGDMVFYTSTGDVNGNDYKFIQFKARFTDGNLEWIKEFPREAMK